MISSILGLVENNNKSNKISQIIYNKNKQLDYKLIKSSRKRGYNAYMLEQLREQQHKNKGIWRLEVQAYGYKAIDKAVNSYNSLMKKLTRCLKLSVRMVNLIDKRELQVGIEFIENASNFTNWFNDKTPARLKPPNLIIA